MLNHHPEVTGHNFEWLPRVRIQRVRPLDWFLDPQKLTMSAAGFLTQEDIDEIEIS